VGFILLICSVFLFITMEVVKTSAQLAAKIKILKASGKIIGFVPTMGALHEGHLSLVKEAGRFCDVVVVSVFVNPTQFNNPDDLIRYPRDIEKDMALLRQTPCELLFVPSVNEVYPEPDTRVFDFGLIDKVMEGKFRPGHFIGVAQVVSRLFDIVRPHKAFFGAKDFQQIAVVREMVRQLNLPVQVIDCPIIREKDGLAMSSRNLLLNAEQRKKAPLIARSLFDSCNFALTNGVKETRQMVTDAINASSQLEVEYFEIVDGNTLQPVMLWDDSDFIVGCIAVYAGEIRLIDNVVYKNSMS
jgi:pantoate--beta-alanine ligase